MPVCAHCGERYDDQRPNCPHCGADKEQTWSHDGEYHEELQDFDDEAEYRDFLAKEGLDPSSRKGCLSVVLVATGLVWVLL